MTIDAISAMIYNAKSLREIFQHFEALLSMTEGAEVSAVVGARVVRGPAWESADDCDGGEGGLGTVTALGTDHVAVTWDTGASARHASRELRLVDSGPAGVRHAGVVCSACNAPNVAGLRWRCSCAGVDLCSKCYASNEHDLAHAFQCHAYEGDKGFAVSVRRESRTLQLKGIFVGAKVVRGRDWSWGDQDGGPMSLPGTVMAIEGWETDSVRSVATVFWPSIGQEQVYRVGHKGKVDLQLVSGHAAGGGMCYVDHLPVISVPEVSQLETYDSGVISVGDRVKIVVDAEALRQLQVGHGNYNVRMSELVGVAGTVHRITANGDVRVQYQGRPEQSHRWTLNPEALRKIKADSFKMGDLVRVLSDEAQVRQLQVRHGEWNDSMRRALGEAGSVVKVYADGDLRVTIKGQTWTFNPLCVHAVHNNRTSAAANATATQKRKSYLPTDEEKQFVSWAVGGDVEAVRHALALNPSAVTAKVARAALQGAAQEGHLEVVDTLCSHFPAQTHAKYKGTTALHVALHQGHLRVAERLLAAGVPTSDVTCDDAGDSWLHYCAYGKQADGVELVMARGLQNVNVSNEKGSTALHVAVMLQDEQCVRALLRHSADVNLADADGDTALHEAVAKDSAAIVQLLLEAPGVNASAINGSGLSAMHRAAMKGNAAAVRVLLAHDAKLVQDVKQDGFYPLHLAALNGHAEVVELLLGETRCEVNARDNAGRTALHHACFQGKRDVARVLIDVPGVDVGARDANGNTPLHVALSREGEVHDGRGAEDEAGDEHFQQALAAGVEAGLAAWVALGLMLLAKGADATVRNRKGHAAFDRLQDVNARAVLLKKALEQEPIDSGKKCDAGGDEAKTEGEDDFGDQRVECQVCSELTRAVILKPCDHAVACADCTRRMKKCLVCKEPIRDLVFPVAEGVAASPSSSPFSRHRSASSHVRDLEARVLDFEEQYMCSICMERRKNVAFLCGHGACTECVHTLKLCHMCRSPISGKINLY